VTTKFVFFFISIGGGGGSGGGCSPAAPFSWVHPWRQTFCYYYIT